MSNRNIVPYTDSVSTLGTASKQFGGVFALSIKKNGTEVLSTVAEIFTLIDADETGNRNFVTDAEKTAIAGVTSQATAITALQTTTTSHTTSISTLNTTTSTNTTSISTLNTTVSGHTTSISTLETASSDYSTRISDLETADAAQDVLIAANATAIATKADIASYLLYEAQESEGTDGGTFTQDAWQTLLLTETTDADSVGTVAAGVITLGAGTYEFSGFATASEVGEWKIRVQNTTSATSITQGANASAVAAGSNTVSYVSGRFTLGSTASIALQAYCTTTKATTGLGVAVGAGPEKYAQLEIHQIG